MKISYSILTHNEDKSLQKLLEFLVKHKDEEDEIVILDDFSDNPKTIEILDVMTSMHEMTFEQRHLLKDYAGQKNYLTRMCKNDYIVNIDADEIPHEVMIAYLPEVLETNPVDIIFVPRVNTVNGLTQKHISKWKWNVNEKGWVNWPDYQTRIYKNTEDVTWMNKVHEKITGYDTFSNFPAEEHWALYHPKQIKRQEQQNKFYETI